jgi:hypothetical protein
MLVAGFEAWAALAIVRGSAPVAAVILLLGLLVHETAVIFGVPLTIALAVSHGPGWFRTAKVGQGAALFLAGGLALAAAQALFSAPRNILVQHMLLAGPSRTDAVSLVSKNIATYMYVAGTRGIHTAMCYNFDFQPRYALNAVAGLLILSAYFVILPLRGRGLAFALAAMLPVAIMLIIASDTARWVRLGFVNAWLLAVAGVDAQAMRPGQLLAGTMLFLALSMISPPDYYETTGLVNVAGDALQLPYKAGVLHLQQWMTHCDPHWRAILGRRP